MHVRVVSTLLQALSSLNHAMSQTIIADRGRVMDFGALVVEGLKAQEQLASQGMESPSDTGEPKDLV